MSGLDEVKKGVRTRTRGAKARKAYEKPTVTKITREQAEIQVVRRWAMDDEKQYRRG